MQLKLLEHFSSGYSKEIKVNPVRPPSGPAAGDMLLVERPLLEASSGSEAGTLVLVGVYVRVDSGSPLLAWNASNKLQEGIINTQGAARLSEFASGVTFAIVGGTRKYKHARGTVTAQTVDPDTNKLTYEVTP